MQQAYRWKSNDLCNNALKELNVISEKIQEILAPAQQFVE
jgi:hypothetical protein